MMVYQETFGQRNQHRIYLREHPEEEPAIILMHGFPDNVHVYDRLFPTGRILLLFGTVGLTASPSIGQARCRAGSPRCGQAGVKRVGAIAAYSQRRTEAL
jgi:hypothetical protein